MNKNSKISKIIKLSSSQKITCLTAYGFNIAKLLDDICDIILVGDSLGMALYGMENTQEVTMDMMIRHAQSVTKAAKKPLIVVDMPFGSYENNKNDALNNAKRIITQSGCDAIKIEIDENTLPIAKYLCQNNINLMGHIGLLPQHCKNAKDFRYKATSNASAKELMDLAKKIEDIGAFSIVIEAVPEKVASKISKSLQIITIGIGASADCSGQILVTDDMLGINQDFNPKFLKDMAIYPAKYLAAPEDIKKILSIKNFLLRKIYLKYKTNPRSLPR